MPNYSSALKPWGSYGAEYPDNYNHIEGERPVDDWENYVKGHLIDDVSHLIGVTNNPVTVNAGNQLTGGGNVELGGSITIGVNEGAGSGLNADLLDGNHASDLGSGASDSGIQVLSTSTDFNFGTGLSVTDDADGTVTIDGHSKYTDSEASAAAPVQTVNGQTGNISISGFSGSHTDLTNVGSSDHHARYTDSEAITAIESGDSIGLPSYATKSDPISLNGGDLFYVTDDGLYIENTYNGTVSEDPTPLNGHVSDTTNPHNVTASQTGAQSHINSTTNPHSVTASQIGISVLSMTTSSGQDVNQTIAVNWDEHLVTGGSSFSHDASTSQSSVTINESGTYKMYANLYSDTSSSRTNPSFRFRVNGTEVAGRSGSAYARNAEGHTHTSTSLEIVRDLNPGDTIDIYTFSEASGGTCLLQNRRSIFTIEKMVR